MASSQRQEAVNGAAEAPPSFSVDITKENFSAMLPVVQEALDKCTFYSFDCEMTGLFLENNRHEYLDDMQDRHAKFVESSHAFVINQYGLSAFERTGPDTYVARTFNFYLFPQPFESYNRRFVSEAASLAFLASQGFDFNKCIYHGVPFMPMRTLNYRLTQLERNSEPRTNPASATRPEDIAYVQELVSSVQAWMAEGTTDSLELELSFNGFLRMLAYQELEKAQFGVEGHPGFYVDRNKTGERNGAPRITLRRMSPEDAARLEAEAYKTRAAALREAAGFAAVFDMMRASGKPGVGHNCMFDVAYALQNFAVGDLPGRWSEFKALAAYWHSGGLYDTKYLARQLPEVFGAETSLGDVFRALVHGERAEQTTELLQRALEAAAAEAGPCDAQEPAGADQSPMPLRLPSIEHAPGFEKYRDVEAGALAHEAGYDAYMTGAAFASLLPLIEAKARTDPSSEVAQAKAEAAAARAAAAEARAAAAEASAVAAVGNGVAAAEASAAAAVGNGVVAAVADASANGNKAALSGSQPVDAAAGAAAMDDGTRDSHAAVTAAAAATEAAAAATVAATAAALAAAAAATAATAAATTAAPSTAAGEGGGGIDAFEWVRPLVGRLNLGRSDMPYAALRGEDPVLERPYVFHLAGMEAGWRVGDVQRWVSQAGLSKPRVTVLDASAVLIELEPEEAALALPKLQASQNFSAMPWAEYSAQKRAAATAQEAARQQLWQEQQQQRKERRQQQQQQQQAAAADGAVVGAKRQREGDPMDTDQGPQQDTVAAAPEGRSSCAIM